MKNNIIKLTPANKKWELSDKPGEISTIARKMVFANATLVDILQNSTKNVDILVENGKVAEIVPRGKLKVDGGTESFNLYKAYVLPPFFDACKLHRNIFDEYPMEGEKGQRLFEEVSSMDMLLSGVTSCLTTEQDDCLILQNLCQMDEGQLSELSNKVAKENKLLFLKVGQTLEELGSVDKTFGKPLPQMLEDFGFLDRKWALVGGNCFEKDDLQLFSQYGNKFIICPAEDAQFGRRPINLKTLKNLGFDIRLGSGGVFGVDFFALMRQVLSTQWQFFEDCNSISEKDALMMATDNFSTLEVGMQANFIVVKNIPSLYKSVSKQLVWEKHKDDVLLTVWDGKIMQEYIQIEDQLKTIEEIKRRNKK